MLFHKEIKGKSLPILAFFGANGISVLGNALTALAIPWFVLQTTGSAAQMGLTACVEVVANLVAGAFGGTLVDRVSQKRISILADLASGFAVALVPLLYYTVGLAFWELLMLVFCASLCNALGTTARIVWFPDIAALADMYFERANSILQTIQRGAGLVGAPLAGALIVVLGTTRLLWVDATSFLLSACIVALALPASRTRAACEAQPETSRISAAQREEGLAVQAEERPSWQAGLKLSFQTLWRDRLLLAIMVVLIITNLLDGSLFAVVMPIYARVHFGSALAFGLASAAFGGGALLGSILFSVLSVKLPRRLTFSLTFIGMGLPFWTLALLPVLPVMLLAAAIGGIASAPINPIIMTVAMERVPAERRGRVLGPLTALALIAVPLGLLLIGASVERLDLQGTLFLMAAAYLVATLSLLFNPTMRQMERGAGAENRSTA